METSTPGLRQCLSPLPLLFNINLWFHYSPCSISTMPWFCFASSFPNRVHENVFFGNESTLYIGELCKSCKTRVKWCTEYTNKEIKLLHVLLSCELNWTDETGAEQYSENNSISPSVSLFEYHMKLAPEVSVVQSRDVSDVELISLLQWQWQRFGD